MPDLISHAGEGELWRVLRSIPIVDIGPDPPPLFTELPDAQSR